MEETTTTNEILVEEETQEQQEETTTDLNTYCNCDYSQQLETIILQQDNIYQDLHNTTQLFKHSFMIVLIVFLMVVIYKFLNIFF